MIKNLSILRKRISVNVVAASFLAGSLTVGLAQEGGSNGNGEGNGGQQGNQGGQDDEDPVQAELDRQLALITARAGIAAQQKALIDNLLPSSVTPLDGTATAEASAGDPPIETFFLAYDQLQKGATLTDERTSVATEIAKEIVSECGEAEEQKDGGKVAKRPARPVVIHDDADVKGILEYQGYLVQLGLIAKQLAELRAEVENAQDEQSSVLLAPQIVSGALGAAADIVALFRANLTFRRSDITVDEQAVIASVAGAIKGCPVYYPKQMPPQLLQIGSYLMDQLAAAGRERHALHDAITERRGTLQKSINTATKRVKDKEKEIAPFKDAITKITVEIAKLKKEGKPTGPKEMELRAAKQKLADSGIETQLELLQGQKKKFDQELAKFNAAVKPAEKVVGLYDGLRAALVSRNADTGESVLGGLLRVEKLYQVISTSGEEKDCEQDICPGFQSSSESEETETDTVCCRKGNAFFLSLKFLKAGGTELVKRNLWTPGPAKVFYNGGSAVSYILYSPEGNVASSGIFAKRSDWIRAELPNTKQSKTRNKQSDDTPHDGQR